MTGLIVESHAHYEDDRYHEDREAVLSGLREQGVGIVVNVGSSMQSTKDGLELAHQYPFLYLAAGVHPEECASMTDADIDRLREYASDPKVVSIGEIGLDYYWKEPAPSIQKIWFEKQIGRAHV